MIFAAPEYIISKKGGIAGSSTGKTAFVMLELWAIPKIMVFESGVRPYDSTDRNQLSG